MTNDEIALGNQELDLFLDIYKITNDQGEQLDFKNHAFLYDIYTDFTPKQAIRKAAQIGFSTMANIKALWVAKNKRMDIIYSLPSASDIKDFVSGKTNRLIDYNPVFQEWTADKDSVEQKRVGDNIIYFKGTWTERAAIATPADLYISDETDRSKQEIVAQFSSRLQHSKYQWEWYFSNPSVPGHGVDKWWEKSDQKHWFIRCSGCNHDQYLTMDNVMDGESGPYFGCTQCKKELDRRFGRWVRRFQDREVSGYWISLLMCPWVSASKILEYKREKSEEFFANFVLGQPYIGKGNVLTRQMILQNLQDRINPQDTRPIIGVDTGTAIKLCVGNKYGTFYYNETNDYEELRALMLRWKDAICVIDQGGDIIGPRKLRDEFPGRVYLCFFRPSSNSDELIKWNDEQRTVTVDRDRLIQTVVDEFVEKRMPLYGSEADWHIYINEWVGMYRTMEESSLGVPKFHWNKPSSGRCDYPFAQVYLRVGLDRFLNAKTTFHNPAGDSYASQGLEVSPDGTTFLPKKQLSS